MAGIKRKTEDEKVQVGKKGDTKKSSKTKTSEKESSKAKKPRTDEDTGKRASKDKTEKANGKSESGNVTSSSSHNKTKQSVATKNKKNKKEESEDISEDESEDEGGVEVDMAHVEERDTSDAAETDTDEDDAAGEADENKNASSKSRESHVQQRAVAQSRKAAKPNADVVARLKKLWERLRRKSHVPLDERKVLLSELFSLIEGRVKDLVFKHDSVRVIQTALKYANQPQRLAIANELRGEFRSLAESRYAKFLIAKMLVHGDDAIRDMIVPEFFGHVRRLMRHPEASWILDDIYRTVATRQQRDTLLKEWYGPEFVFLSNDSATPETSNLSDILAQSPEKRSPIMQYLRESINHLIQKQATGFTMLHDAMLQYFLNVKPGSTEAIEFIELLKGDEEGDLMKNLAFTGSGSRVVCLAFAYSSAKDRKLLLRVYKDLIKTLAGDTFGHLVLLAVFEVVDDTRLTAKSIFPELLNQGASEEDRNAELLYQVTDLTARIPILHTFAEDKPKWLLPDPDHAIIDEIRAIRSETSKKSPELRRKELIKAATPTLLDFISSSADRLVETSFGCQFLTEVILSAEEEDSDGTKRDSALSAIAATTKTNPDAIPTPHAGRMLKALVQGGRFDPSTKKVSKVDPPLGFPVKIYQAIQGEEEIMKWTTSINPFVIVALVESDEEFEGKEQLLAALKKNKKVLQKLAAESESKEKRNGGNRSKHNNQQQSEAKTAGPARSAAKLLLQKL